MYQVRSRMTQDMDGAITLIFDKFKTANVYHDKNFSILITKRDMNSYKIWRVLLKISPLSSQQTWA